MNISKIILHCEDIKHLSKIFSEDFILKFLQENTSVMSRCINKVMSSPFICEGENVFLSILDCFSDPKSQVCLVEAFRKSSDWKEEYTVGLPIDLQNYLHNTAAMMTYGEIWSAAIHTYHLDMEKTHDSCCKIGSLPIGVLAKISLFASPQPDDYRRNQKSYPWSPESFFSKELYQGETVIQMMKV